MFKLVVLSVILAVTSASGLGPLGWGSWGGLAGGHLAPWGLGNNYRGPLSLAPGQPATILAADGRPLDTLSVNLDRAAHFTARAVDAGHLLKKRSIVAPALAWSHSARVVAPIAPLGYAPLGVAPLGLGYGARWGYGW